MRVRSTEPFHTDRWCDLDTSRELGPCQRLEIRVLANDLALSIVGAGHPANVDTVTVAGRIVKRDGRLVDVDMEALRTRAEASRHRLFATAAAGD